MEQRFILKKKKKSFKKSKKIILEGTDIEIQKGEIISEESVLSSREKFKIFKE